MKFLTSIFLVCAVCLTVTSPAQAQFNAADLVYLPVAAHSPGVNDSLWRTDLYITNVDTEPIDVAMTFIPGGRINNSYLLFNRLEWLGGRVEDGWGVIDEGLINIPAGGSVFIGDVIGDYFIESVGLTGGGAMIIMAWEAGTLDAEDGRVLRNVVVNSRTYNQATIWVEDPDNDGEFIEEEATYGQNVPGVAWYNMGDAGLTTENGDFSYQVLNVGLYEEDFRYNLGIVNASDGLTTLNITLTPYQMNGEPYLDDNDDEILYAVVMPPVSQLQFNGLIENVFGITDQTVAKIVVKVESWTTSNATPVPLFTTYGSLVDNRTSDATTVLPSFEAPYNIDCMWAPADDPEKRKQENRERPINIPPRN